MWSLRCRHVHVNTLSFINIPVIHFPWSDKAREGRQKDSSIDKTV